MDYFQVQEDTPLYNFYVLLDFSLTVKAATLIFISGRGSAISSAKEGKLSYFLPLFDRPKINIVFSNTLKARSCIAKQVHKSKTTL